MDFPNKLRKLRKEKGLSQEKLAELLNISRQSISKWESGQTYPEVEKLITLSELFKISVDDLVKNGEIKTDSTDDSVVKSEEEKGELLIIGGFILGFAVSMITDNFLFCIFGPFVGLGISYLVEAFK